MVDEKIPCPINTNIIEVSKVSLNFSTLQVLKDWSLTVKAGERIALLGPSGSGKTSFLRLLAALEKPSQGELKVNSDHLGFVFQEPRLVPWLTVKENLSIISRTAPWQELLAALYLDNFGDYYPHQLSRGMQQRVNIARAMLLKPEIILLDEAFAALDWPLKIKIMDLILAYRENNNATLIAATHDLKEALYLADRILILSSAPAKIIREFPVTLPAACPINSPAFLKLEQQLLDIIIH
jgi:ABC-type nitrate/sulfonate/bicarbonate transport system ATPase subunit